MKIAVPRTAEEAVARFRMLIGQRIPYLLEGCPTWQPDELPALGTPGNCSIAATWALGLRIHQPLDTWLNSSGIVSDAHTPGGLFTQIAAPMVGCLVVFPWKDGHPGHVGMVTQVSPPGRVSQVIHCSPRNGRDDSVRETGPEVFLARPDMIYAWHTGIASSRDETPVYTPPAGVIDRLGHLLGAVHRATRLTPQLEGLEYMAESPGAFLYFQSDLDLDTDGKRSPGVAYEKTHQDQTSLAGVDSNVTPYFVLPGGFAAQHGIKLGDLAVVLYRDRIEFAVYADSGPRSKIGEGSIALHRALGFERVGGGGRIIDVGIPRGVVTVVFPGSGNGTAQTPESVRLAGAVRFRAIGGAA